MNDIIVLDSEPVGLLTNPRPHPKPVAIRQWLTDHLAAGHRVILPEIIDYEVRREFLMANMTQSLKLLESLTTLIEYQPLNTAIMRHAADLWAQVRRGGQPTADPHALDADVILAAQALSVGRSVVVATSNPTHITRFVPAERWEAITP